MELSQGSLRRNGINTLAGAVHDKHGLAWTDGKSVYLSPVKVFDEEVENEDAIKLGEFDSVQSLHWSCDMGNYCYLCLVHQTTVSIWKVTGATPSLHFKQVRKINASPIPQGVLWSPNRDILCILNREQCSFYFRHAQNRGSYALPPIESGKVSSGCWSDDGQRLTVGIGSILLIYQWHDIDRSISEFTIIAWKIPNVDGKIRCIDNVDPTRMVCTAELPLDVLVKPDQQDMFVFPNSGNGEGLLNNQRNDDVLIKPNKSASNHKEKLLNLQKKHGAVEDCSQLILFEIRSGKLEPSKLAAVNVSGILTPDLLLADSHSNHIVVASNCQPSMSVFHIETDDSLTAVHEIKLQNDDRPKGVCRVPFSDQSCAGSDGCLVMVGKLPPADSTFLPSSSAQQYSLTLQFHSFIPGYYYQPDGYKEFVQTPGDDQCYSSGLFRELQLPSGNTRVHLLRINPLGAEDKESKNGASTHEHRYNKEVHSSSSSGVSGNKRSMSAVEKKSKKKHHKFEMPKQDMMLPCDSISTASSEGSFGYSSKRGKGGLVMMLDGSEGDLETEHVSFHENAPTFSTTVDFRTKKDHEAELANLVEQFPSLKNKLGIKNFIGSSHNKSPRVVSPRSFEHEMWNGDTPLSPPSKKNSSGKKEKEKNKKRRSSRSVMSDDEASANMENCVTAIETQIHDQTSQISKLQDRIEQISKILEETDLICATNYQTIDAPEVVQLVYNPKNGRTGVKKSFILDSGRLQLDPVKETFGLKTVELILDGVPCVLGSNIDGYVPIKFVPNATYHIQGKQSD